MTPRVIAAMLPPPRGPRGFRRPPTNLLQHVLYFPRDAAVALPRRLACRAGWHTRGCRGDLHCREHARRD